MPTAVTFPGVYIEEISSGVHTISGVATSIAAFVGFYTLLLVAELYLMFKYARLGPAVLQANVPPPGRAGATA